MSYVLLRGPWPESEEVHVSRINFMSGFFRNFLPSLLFPYYPLSQPLRPTGSANQNELDTNLHRAPSTSNFVVHVANPQNPEPTGSLTVTLAASDPYAYLTIIQTLSYVSCSSLSVTVNPFFQFLNVPTTIYSGNQLGAPVVLRGGPYATTTQTLLATELYPTIPLTVLASLSSLAGSVLIGDVVSMTLRHINC